MPEHCHLGDTWAHNTLARVTRMGQSLHKRATARHVPWPNTNTSKSSPLEDPVVYTNIDDAFSTVLQGLAATSRQCKRFYASSASSSKDACDHHHTNRFHTPHYTRFQHKNPLEASEGVHMILAPGSYAVTAGVWGEEKQQTHVVHVDGGHTVSLDFVL